MKTGPVLRALGRLASGARWLAAGALLSAVSAQADVFKEDFNSGVPSPLLIVGASPGFSVSFAGGDALMSQAAGTGNGGVSITATFRGLGDFETTVKANRQGTGAAQFGITLGFADAVSPWGDVFFGQYLGQAIWSNVGTGTTVWASNGIATSVQDAVLRMRRTGNTLYAEADVGSGFVLLNSYTSPVVSGPAQFSLFFSQEFGITAANHGRLDDWQISATSLVPEGTTAVYLALGLAALAGVGQRRKSAACRSDA